MKRKFSLKTTEIRQVRKLKNALIRLQTSLQVKCPVCEWVRENTNASVVHSPPSCHNECPASEGCKAYTAITYKIHNTLWNADCDLVDLDKFLSVECEHEWTADQDNQCNVCIKCDATKDHF